jgi:hypothetical protein
MFVNSWCGKSDIGPGLDASHWNEETFRQFSTVAHRCHCTHDHGQNVWDFIGVRLVRLEVFVVSNSIIPAQNHGSGPVQRRSADLSEEPD